MKNKGRLITLLVILALVAAGLGAFLIVLRGESDKGFNSPAIAEAEPVPTTREKLTPPPVKRVPDEPKPVAPPVETPPPVAKSPPPSSGTPSAPAVKPKGDYVRPFPFEGDRTVTGSDSVSTGDTLNRLSKKYWGDERLWPDLYVHNAWRTNDPDLIYPGETVKVLNKLGKNGVLGDAEKKVIDASYLRVYKLYKAQGAKRESSRLYAIVSACRFNPNFMRDYADSIDSGDIAKATRLLKESKFLS